MARYAYPHKAPPGKGRYIGIHVVNIRRAAGVQDELPRLKTAACLMAVCIAALLPAEVRADDSCHLNANPAGEEWQGQHAWQTLQDAGYRVGQVKIVVDNVFDLNNPVEDTWYGQTADALHIQTHPNAIRAELLFKPGEPVDARVVYESERRLRALPFVRSADVTPVACKDGVVDVVARVKDAWTLKFNLSFAHVGGQSTLNASFEDVDFLGTAKTLSVGHFNNTQHSGNQLGYVDPALFGSTWQMDATYAHLSDGSIRAMDVGQPFYEDATPWSLFLHYLDQEQDLNFYDQGNLAWRAEDIQHVDELDWSRLVYWREDHGLRAGLSYVYQDFAYGSLETFPQVTLPQPSLPPRRFGEPALSAEYFEDRYATFTNLALMSKAEDYDLGWDSHAQLGYLSTRLGSNLPGWTLALNGSYGRDFGGDTLMLASGSVSGRHQAGEYQDSLANLTLTLYNQSFDRQTLVLHATVDYSLRPDPEYQLYLGGIQGMPGYPNYFLIGDRRWEVDVADRLFTPVRILNTFQVGFTAYADAGQVREFDTGNWSRTLADAGIGLRLGDVRSAFGGVIYMTFAWPLVKLSGADQRQFVIGNIVNF